MAIKQRNNLILVYLEGMLQGLQEIKWISESPPGSYSISSDQGLPGDTGKQTLNHSFYLLRSNIVLETVENIKAWENSVVKYRKGWL